jgi:hypothetical protein
VSRLALPLVLLVGLLVPTAAVARDADVWATVNVCDTAKQPDTIGIRASMTGTPKGVRLSMRFRVQYQAANGTWADVENADSGWRALGTAKGIPVESGWSFSFTRPSKAVTLRGVAKFRWRKGDALPRTDEVVTEAGHRSSAGADPAGYSAASCELGS